MRVRIPSIYIIHSIANIKITGPTAYIMLPTLKRLKLLLHSSNLLTVARMEVKLGAHVYYIVSMTTTTTNSLRHFSLKLLLRSSHLLTVARMEVRLGTYAYYNISMTITCFHDDN